MLKYWPFLSFCLFFMHKGMVYFYIQWDKLLVWTSNNRGSTQSVHAWTWTTVIIHVSTNWWPCNNYDVTAHVIDTSFIFGWNVTRRAPYLHFTPQTWKYWGANGAYFILFSLFKLINVLLIETYALQIQNHPSQIFTNQVFFFLYSGLICHH